MKPLLLNESGDRDPCPGTKFVFISRFRRLLERLPRSCASIGDTDEDASSRLCGGFVSSNPAGVVLSSTREEKARSGIEGWSVREDIAAKIGNGAIVYITCRPKPLQVLW